MLTPAFLLAAAINEQGYIALPAVVGGATFPVAQAHFAPDDRGGFVQRVTPAVGSDERWKPLDMAFFARCLGLALGAVTPGIFAVRGIGAAVHSHGRLARRDPASEEERLRALRSAFLIHLAAYEERVV
jgi:hypothetical protein